MSFPTPGTFSEEVEARMSCFPARFRFSCMSWLSVYTCDGSLVASFTSLWDGARTEGSLLRQRQKLLMVTRTQRGLEACAHAQNWKSLITSTPSPSPLRPAMGQLERKCGPYITGMDVRRKWWADCYSSPVCCPLNDSARALVIADRRGVQKPRVTDEVGVGVARGQTPPWCCVCLSGRCLGRLLCLSVELRKLKLITKSTSSSLSRWWIARQSLCVFVCLFVVFVCVCVSLHACILFMWL